MTPWALRAPSSTPNCRRGHRTAPHRVSRCAPLVGIYDAPTIQIVSRDALYDVADARAQAAYNALSAVQGRMFGALYCHQIWCMQPPGNALGRGADNLWLVSFNVAIRKSIA